MSSQPAVLDEEVEEFLLQEVPPLGLHLPGGLHESIVTAADAHARAIVETRKFRSEARMRERYPDTMPTFIQDVLGMELTPNQLEIVEAVQKYRRVAIKSCHGSGKTRVLAAIVIAFAHQNPFSKIVTTGPGGTQLKEGLWQDIRFLAAQARRPLLGEPLTTKWEIAPGWFILGYKPAENKATNLQGIHAPRMLLVIDEAAEVEQEIYDALSSLMTSENCTLVMIGNPTRINNPFYAAFTANSHLWHNITIKAEDTPNVQLGYEKFPGLITREWVYTVTEENGEESDYVRSRVFAEFPKTGVDTYIPLAWLDAVDESRFPITDDDGPWEAGIDVARYGSDKTSIAIRCGGRPVFQESWAGLDTMETVGRCLSILESYPPMNRVKVDTIGLGAGVADRLRELKYPVIDVVVSEKSSSPREFANLRHELWWAFREQIRLGEICGPLPKVAKAQLASIKSKFDSSHSRPLVESKEAMRDRGLGSPDDAEAWMLAFTCPVIPEKKVRKQPVPVSLVQNSAWGERV